MSSAALQSPPAPPQQRRPTLQYVAAVVFVAIIVGEVVLLLRGPSFVDQVRFTNRSGLLIDVDVTDEDRDGWIAVAIVRPQQTVTTREVIDQGATWIFRFRSAGHDGGEIRITRKQLERSRWTVVIPAWVVERLVRAGAQPTPPGIA